MQADRAIHWFRQDLRLGDNPALRAACQHGQVLPIYIHDDTAAGAHALGAASRVWLHHSLADLNQALGGHLCILQGDAQRILTDLVAALGIAAVYWNRCYEPWRITQDKAIKAALKAQAIHVQSFNASLLWEPWDVCKADGTPYRMFTPFYRKRCLQAPPPRKPLAKPRQPTFTRSQQGIALADLGLLPDKPWGDAMISHWQVGEQAAHQRLKAFIKKGLQGYKKGRDFPAQDHVSCLSAYLHFGEISPHQVWCAVQHSRESMDGDHFLSELAWREFSYHLLFHFPTLPRKNLQSKFDGFAWRHAPKALQRWQQGQTGYPIIDAGMRELWQTGYMHNRVRMVVASFLVKNLRLHWHAGEAWFWDCLIDADLANNSASWQWVAGSGADAAPYFRIFNPVTQAEKFDPNGVYIRQYVPELAALPDRYLFAPWLTPASILAQAHVKLGQTYPKPIVDLAQSRQAALAAYQAIR